MKIKITKFKRVENLEIEVPAQISGANEAGKTTILEAISFCLTGKNLDGSDFKQVYDNRVDLHEAIADVTYSDSYGNTYQRIVTPTFQVSKTGEEQIKILRSTRCKKNDIDVKDYAPEFEDFYKFGTDYFFSLKESEQRNVFIDLMKSKLPDFDVKAAQEKLATLKKQQSKDRDKIKILRESISEIKDVEVEAVPSDLQAQEKEYQKKIASMNDHKRVMNEIMRRNRESVEMHESQLRFVSAKAADTEKEIERLKSAITAYSGEIGMLREVDFVGYESRSTVELEANLAVEQAKLHTTPFFQEIEEYAENGGLSNPVIQQNIERIKRLEVATVDNLPDGEKLTDICPTCGERSDKILQKGVSLIIEGLKDNNRAILQREMMEANSAYYKQKSTVDRLTEEITAIKAENKRREEREATEKRAFLLNRTNKIDSLTTKIEANGKKLKELEEEKKTLSDSIKKLEENKPQLEEIPASISIPDELTAAHMQFNEKRDAVVGAQAINRNNEEKREEGERKIKEIRETLMKVDREVVELMTEISNYFSNLKGVVEVEFSGEIKIGVELLEYVITRDEYKDVFKITANGNVFPYDCNGALINNTKLQVLRTLQRLKDYTGLTIVDNTEANTTQSVNSQGLNLIAARATFDKELKIEKL